jgi:molybdopterin/thiamine biosynthesis adenylyltransferase
LIDSQTAYWQIRATLEKRGFTSSTACPSVYWGKLRAGHTDLEIEIEVSDVHFSKFPKIRVLNRSNLSSNFLAHLEASSTLCYADGSLLVLDRYQPGASILRVIAEAEKAVNRSLAGKAVEEISKEYPSYWVGNPLQIMFTSHQSIDHGIVANPDSKSKNISSLVLLGTQTLPMGYTRGRKVLVVNTEKTLKPSNTVVSPSSLAEVREWHNAQQGLPISSLEKVQSALLDESIVFYHGQNGWVGCSVQLPPKLEVLRKVGKSGPQFFRKMLLQDERDVRLSKYHGKEASLEFITSRNLTPLHSPISGKRIAVVGCGSVGSHLARFLVQSGAGNGATLVLVDPEPLVAANLGRHLLNFDDVGKMKANALAETLRKFHPDLQIRSIDLRIESAWKSVEDFDLIVDATGMESTSEFINAEALKLRSSGRKCAVLHAFLFANGISTRTLLNAGEGFACYRCQRPNLADPWIDDPRKNVKAAPIISPANCGDGPFVPFSVSAPVSAATSALSAIIDFLSGKIGHRMRNQLLDRENAKEVRDKSPTAHAACPACSGQQIAV